jgi:hypothetical protein
MPAISPTLSPTLSAITCWVQTIVMYTNLHIYNIAETSPNNTLKIACQRVQSEPYETLMGLCKCLLAEANNRFSHAYTLI